MQRRRRRTETETHHHASVVKVGRAHGRVRRAAAARVRRDKDVPRREPIVVERRLLQRASVSAVVALDVAPDAPIASIASVADPFSTGKNTSRHDAKTVQLVGACVYTHTITHLQRVNPALCKRRSTLGIDVTHAFLLKELNLRLHDLAHALERVVREPRRNVGDAVAARALFIFRSGRARVSMERSALCALREPDYGP
jgi:hypothetical protein